MTEKTQIAADVQKFLSNKDDKIWLIQQGRTLDKLQRMVELRQKDIDMLQTMLEEIEGSLLQNRLTKEPVKREEAELYVRVMELCNVDSIALRKAWDELMEE